MACASTGEGLALQPAERAAVIDRTIAAAAGRVPVHVGCSAYSTAQVIAHINDATERGAAAAMITHPYYALPDPAELLTHYRAVSSAVDLPVITTTRRPPGSTPRPSSSPNRRASPPRCDQGGSGVAGPAHQHAHGRQHPVLCGTDNQALEQFVGGARWVAGVAKRVSRLRGAASAVERNDLPAATEIYDRIYLYLTEAELTGKYVQVNKLGLELQDSTSVLPAPPLQPVTARAASG